MRGEKIFFATLPAARPARQRHDARRFGCAAVLFVNLCFEGASSERVSKPARYFFSTTNLRPNLRPTPL
jgi:hypothetical protein